MDSISKIRIYTNGIVDEGIGAYAYVVLENKCCGEVAIGEGKGRMFAPSLLRAKFAQAGKADDAIRMKMRAVYEGLRHCPDNREIEVYSDNFLIKDILETTKLTEADGDIADKYRSYIAGHSMCPQFCAALVYHEKDFPDNDHDEWTWYAHYLCENEIKRYRKEKK